MNGHKYIFTTHYKVWITPKYNKKTKSFSLGVDDLNTQNDTNGGDEIAFNKHHQIYPSCFRFNFAVQEFQKV